MSYSIIPTPEFKKVFKRLSKKYRSLKQDMAELAEELEDNPRLGIEQVENVYKVRMAIASKGKGKSGGGRVITYLVSEDKEIYLIYIFDKSEIGSVSKAQIREMLKRAGLL